MRIFLVALLLTIFLPFVNAAQVQAAPDPLTCIGYAEPRVFLDDQSWWLRTPGLAGKNFGHVHAATCFPLFQTMRGVVPFDVRLTMHENPGRIEKLTIHVEGGNGGIYILADRFFNPPLTCATTCDFWVHLDANTNAVPIDGVERFTFRALVVEPDGNEMHTGSSWRATLANGKPRIDSTPVTRTTGKGWYTKTLYANSTVDNFTYGAVWSGVRAVKVVCNASKTTTGCLVTVDPNFHMGIEGTVLLRTTGQFNGTVNLDTRRFPNGPHKLVVKTDVKDPRGSTLSGVLGLPFTIQN